MSRAHHPQPHGLRRRNLLTGMALALLPSTLLVRVGAEGMVWSLWRDARPVALVIVAVAALLGLLAWRAGRS
jgi:hypothetical protein